MDTGVELMRKAQQAFEAALQELQAHDLSEGPWVIQAEERLGRMKTDLLTALTARAREFRVCAHQGANEETDPSWTIDYEDGSLKFYGEFSVSFGNDRGGPGGVNVFVGRATPDQFAAVCRSLINRVSSRIDRVRLNSEIVHEVSTEVSSLLQH